MSKHYAHCWICGSMLGPPHVSEALASLDPIAVSRDISRVVVCRASVRCKWSRVDTVDGRNPVNHLGWSKPNIQWDLQYQLMQDFFLQQYDKNNHWGNIKINVFNNWTVLYIWSSTFCWCKKQIMWNKYVCIYKFSWWFQPIWKH